MKYLTRSNDPELTIKTLEEAKSYFILPKDHELREKYDEYYTELENATSLEEFAEIWNSHTDTCEDGSRLLIKSIE